MHSFNLDLRGGRRLHRDLKCIILSTGKKKAPTADGEEQQILAPGLIFWRTAHQIEANASRVRLSVRVDLIMPTSRFRHGQSSSFFFMLELIRFIFIPFGIDQHTVSLLFGINMCYMVYRARWEACKIVNPPHASRFSCVKLIFCCLWKKIFAQLRFT